jgi:S-adenosylmethionine decarboxylase
VPNEIGTNVELITQALKDIAKLCEMSIVGGPLVLRGVPENPGVTGICVVDFSHISIHTFSNPGEVCIDVFSCKPFDPELIHEYLKKTFHVEDTDAVYVEVKYPKEK